LPNCGAYATRFSNSHVTCQLVAVPRTCHRRDAAWVAGSRIPNPNRNASASWNFKGKPRSRPMPPVSDSACSVVTFSGSPSCREKLHIFLYAGKHSTAVNFQNEDTDSRLHSVQIGWCDDDGRGRRPEGVGITCRAKILVLTSPQDREKPNDGQILLTLVANVHDLRSRNCVAVSFLLQRCAMGRQRRQ
jgi:hypothetical protein